MLVLAAITQWPAVDAILRFVVSGSAAYMAYRAHESHMETWAWVMVATVILYNPLAPLYLGEVQSILDLGAAGVFAAALWQLRRRS